MNRGRCLLLLALVFGIGYLPALFARDLWSSDELRYTEVSRQLGSYGHVLVPHINGNVYAEKPPLFFWLTVGAERLLGDWSLAARTVSLVATILTTLLTIALGRVLFGDDRMAWLSGLVYATFSAVMDRGQEALLDPLLTTFTTAAVLTLVKAQRTTGRPRWGWTLLAILSTGCGCITKGPATLLFVLLGGLVAIRVATGSRGKAVIPPALALLGSGVALLWLYLATLEVGSWFWDYMLIGQNQRRVSGPAEHAKPFYFYLPQLLAMTLPWTLLLPGAVGLAFRRRPAPAPAPAPAPEPAPAPAPAPQRAAQAMLTWFLLLLLVFSAFTGKRPGYIFPILPALALVLGFGIVHSMDAEVSRSRWLLRAPLFYLLPWLTLAAGLGLALGSLFLYLGADTLETAWLSEVPASSLGLTAAAGGGLLVLFWLARRAARKRQAWTAAVHLALVTAALGLVFHGPYAAARNPDYSFRPFVREAMSNLPENVQPVLLKHHQNGRIHLYTGVERYPVVVPGDLGRLADRSGRLWLLARERYWLEVPEAVRQRFVAVVEHRVGRKRRRYMLLRER